MPILANARHERFAQELAKGASRTEAYELAGYKPDSGAASRLSGNVSVRARLTELMEAIAERVEVDEAYVLGTIKATVDRCTQATPVLDRSGALVFVETPTGDLAPAYVFDAKSVLRGAELLGKHIGMFKERHEHTGKDGGPIEMADMDLARLITFQLTRAARG